MAMAAASRLRRIPSVRVLVGGIALATILIGCTILEPDYPELPIESASLSTVPPSWAPVQVSAGQAISAAQRATARYSVPAGVGRRLDLESGRTVWVVVFITNRDGRPCGPAPQPGEEQGVCVTVYTGAVIDDQTGAVDHTFEMGTQVWPEQ